jgi:hypothetical protein
MTVTRGHGWSLLVTPKPLRIKGFGVTLLSTPNGIRTRAATLKGWMKSNLDWYESTDERAFFDRENYRQSRVGHSTGINDFRVNF